ncbi:MAG: hypothetical protein KGR98_05610 [Verrucomicrobia bacterium]|nr:hypothetical protein [Verrucomicrobiota bacterium]MDE3100184.1 hypothetical protein [Verrucomicrobiota bacterium]
MSSRFDDRRPTIEEEQAYAEARGHFEGQLQQFPANREVVARVERDLAKIALAANIAASQPAGNGFRQNHTEQWHKDVALADNIYLCHRPAGGSPEFAVVEYAPATGTVEIWTQGRSAVEVLRGFVQEQRQSLEDWTDGMTVQVKKFLAEKYPGQDMSRVADSFMRQVAHPASRPSV